MPTYQYRCTQCGTELEVVQRFSDDPLTVCPTCEGALRKVYSAVGVVFKGSGFYATDNRSTSKPAASKPSDGAGSDTKPAPASTPAESKPSTGTQPAKPASTASSTAA